GDLQRGERRTAESAAVSKSGASRHPRRQNVGLSRKLYFVSEFSGLGAREPYFCLARRLSSDELQFDRPGRRAARVGHGSVRDFLSFARRKSRARPQLFV